MSTAILTMHYIGMEAMRMPATVQHDPMLVFFSVVIAWTASLSALKIGFHYKNKRSNRVIVKIVSASILGLAVAGTHYMGMAATTYYSNDILLLASSDVSLGTLVLASGIGITILFIQMLVTLTIGIDKKLNLKNKQLRSEERRVGKECPV